MHGGFVEYDMTRCLQYLNILHRTIGEDHDGKAQVAEDLVS